MAASMDTVVEKFICIVLPITEPLRSVKYFRCCQKIYNAPSRVHPDQQGLENIGGSNIICLKTMVLKGEVC